MHGLASNVSCFDEFCEHSTVGRSRTLLRADLRGHGAHITREPIDAENWCDDPAAQLDAERVARAVVVGHSLDAQVALRMAARHSARVAGLALIDPVFRAASHGRA